MKQTTLYTVEIPDQVRDDYRLFERVTKAVSLAGLVASTFPASLKATADEEKCKNPTPPCIPPL